MGEVATLTPTTEPLATVVIDRRQAEIIASDVMSTYAVRAEDLSHIGGTLFSAEEMAGLKASIEEMRVLENVLRETGLWEAESSVEWPRHLNVSRDWLINELRDRLASDCDMVLNGTDRSFAAIRGYMAAVETVLGLLEQLGVEESR